MTIQREYNIQREIMLAASQGAYTLWRNNVGSGIQGSRIIHANKSITVKLNSGDAVVRHARRIRFGLCVGSSDLIGLKTITVTEDMVGQQIAIFAAIEVKPPRGKPTEKQTNFIDFVNQAGGIAIIARSPEDIPA